jgi:hypothetical protein
MRRGQSVVSHWRIGDNAERPAQSLPDLVRMLARSAERPRTRYQNLGLASIGYAIPARPSTRPDGETLGNCSTHRIRPINIATRTSACVGHRDHLQIAIRIGLVKFALVGSTPY